MEKKRIVCALKDGEKQILAFRLPWAACCIAIYSLQNR